MSSEYVVESSGSSEGQIAALESSSRATRIAEESHIEVTDATIEANNAAADLVVPKWSTQHPSPLLQLSPSASATSLHQTSTSLAQPHYPQHSPANSRMSASPSDYVVSEYHQDSGTIDHHYAGGGIFALCFRWIAYLAQCVLFLLTFGAFGSLLPPSSRRHRRLSGGEHRMNSNSDFYENDQDLSTNNAARRLRTFIKKGVRLAKGNLHIETELDLESDAGEDSFAVSPQKDSDKTLALERQARREMANIHIRNVLRGVPTEQQRATFKVQACTWNVNQRAPPLYSSPFLTWLLGEKLTKMVIAYQESNEDVLPSGTSTSTVSGNIPLCTSTSTISPSRPGPKEPIPPKLQEIVEKMPDMLIISLQEVDMGGVALVKEQTDCSADWSNAITEALLFASGKQLYYRRVQVVQLVGLMLIVLAQEKHVDFIAHVRLSLTRTGPMRVLGNKGSVGMRATIYGKRFLFVSAHFVAHKYNKNRRMLNYHDALSNLCFQLPRDADDEVEVLHTFANALTRQNACIHNSFCPDNRGWWRLMHALTDRVSINLESRILDQHDYVFFLGDLNSRLHCPADTDVRALVAMGSYDELLCSDELRNGMARGVHFDGFQEASILFPPTYKFNDGTDVYDTSRKRRDPAWCDRILFRLLDSSSNTTASPRDVKVVETPLVRQMSFSSPGIGSESFIEWVSLTSFTDEAMAEAMAADTHPTSSGEDDDDTVFTPGVSMCRSSSKIMGRSCASAAASWSTSPGNTFDNSLSTSMPVFISPRKPSDLRYVRVRFPTVANHVDVLEYYDVRNMKQSDHRPVSSCFEVDVLALDSALVQNIIEEVENIMKEDLMALD